MKDYTKELLEKDKAYIWHPFTQMQEWMESPQLIIERGEGNYLYDTEGNRYFDGVSSLWCNLHGHNHPYLNKAIEEQLKKVAHSTMLGLGNVPSIILAEKLVKISPKGLKRVFYSDNGATAMEIALKMAYQYWYNIGDRKRTKFIILEGAYHGDTIGSVSLGGIPLFHEIFRPLLFKSYKVPAPYCYRCPLKLKKENCSMDCIELAEKTVKEHKDEVVAFVIEPLIQGAAGMITQPKGYLKEIERICRENNILLICDEVATGFGRTGTMFAVEQEDVSPDLMALAKGITAGYLPLAATLSTETIFEAFLGRYEEFKTFFHGHTYTGNPLGCSVAIANIEIFERENVIEKLKPKIRFLEEKLKELWELSHVGDIRQRGFMVGIEIVKDREKRLSYEPKERIGHRIILSARKRGIILRPLGDVIVLMPPLSSTIEELDRLVEVTKESIIEVVGR